MIQLHEYILKWKAKGYVHEVGKQLTILVQMLIVDGAAEPMANSSMMHIQEFLFH